MTTDVELERLIVVDTERLVSAMRAFVDALKPAIDALGRMAALFPSGYGYSGRRRVVAHGGHFVDASNGVPPRTLSPWRLRYERRRYGRELTPSERLAEWRQQWGGLAGRVV